MIQDPHDIKNDQKYLLLKTGDLYVPMGVLYLISNFSKQIAYELLIDSSIKLISRSFIKQKRHI